MRLIDADALLRALAEMWYESQISVTGISVSELINKQPSIDIVRCKECKHASDNKVYGCMCNHFNDNDWDYHRMYADDFCSYGERRE